jgi:5-methylcytosine-specific restriction endonuclease McrA
LDLNAVAREIEDVLFLRLELDVWERALYWHLFRHTHLEGRPATVTGLDTLSRKTGVSTTKLRESIRSMAAKGCLTIDDRNRVGHAITVLLPAEIPGLLVVEHEPPIDIEQIDFYENRRYLQALMERQHGRCVYCLRVLTAESAILDHVVSQMIGGGNSYRNVVVACHACNSRKQAMAAEEYLRLLYREGLLGQDDLIERIETIAQISAGGLIPVIGVGA